MPDIHAPNMPKKKEPTREWSLTQSWHRLPRSSVGIGLYPFFCLLTLLPVTDTRGSISRLVFFFVRKKSSHNRRPLSSFVRPMVYQLSCANFSQRETDLHLKSHTHTHTNLVGHRKQENENRWKFGRQIEKARVESQPIVTIEATLQLTIPALIKSSTKDLWNLGLRMKKWYTMKVNLTKVPDKIHLY